MLSCRVLVGAGRYGVGLDWVQGRPEDSVVDWRVRSAVVKRRAELASAAPTVPLVSATAVYGKLPPSWARRE